MRDLLRLLARYYLWQARVTIRLLMVFRLVPASVGLWALGRLPAPGFPGRRR
jgi:hypothetical protein